MAKRKNRGQKKALPKTGIGRSLPRRALDRLIEAEELSKEGRHAEAREILESLDHRYPNQAEIISDLYNECVHMQDMEGIECAAARLIRLGPEDADTTMSLAGAHVYNGRLALAVRVFRRFIGKWPDHDQIEYGRESLSKIELMAIKLMAEIGFSGDDAFELGELHEESQLLMRQGEPLEARAKISQLLERRPDFIPAMNNLSLIALGEGNLDEAVEMARRVLALDESNIHALSNLTRFLVSRGQMEEARQCAERLKAIDRWTGEVWVKKAEALSYLGDDAGVLEVLREIREAEKGMLPPDAGLIHHLAAVATMRAGNEAEAKRLWKRALEFSPGLEPARANLQDLHNPVGERHAPWPFRANEWTSRDLIAELRDQLASVSSNDKSALMRVGQDFLARHPELNALVPILLERGDEAGRSLAVTVATLAQTPELLGALRDFVFSQNGPDLMRIRSSEILIEKEIMQPGPNRMWIKGKWEEALLMGTAIDGEPIRNVGPKAEPLVHRVLTALRAGDGVKAEKIIRQALEIEPENPMLLNNLLKSFELQGRRREVQELAEELHERFPDYLFGRTNLAMLSIQRGDLDRAAEILKPLYSRKRMHFSEYGAFAAAQIELNLAAGKRDAARHWFEMWERIEPDNQSRERFRHRIYKPKVRDWLKYARR